MTPSKTARARTVLEHLTATSPLTRLLALGAEQRAIQQVLPVILGAELAQHFRVTQRTPTTLTLTASSAARASRLRYEAEALLQKFRTIPALRGLTRIEIRTAPSREGEAALARSTQHSWRASRPSPESAKALASVAMTCTDEKLKAALTRLARLAAPTD